MPVTPTLISRVAAAVLGLLVAIAPGQALAGSPGLDAIRDFKDPQAAAIPVIQNRFFTKSKRFELAPIGGYVPNNPFAKRYIGGLVLAYHFNERIAAEGAFTYSPDAGVSDLKGLTITLVQIAQSGSGDANFQQPLDKVTLTASFLARYSPIYGKINLVGESVVNFDFYGTAGLGMLSKANYYAVYDGSAPEGVAPVTLEGQGNEVKLTPILGAGGNFFITQTIALKLDARMGLFVDNKADYDPTQADATDTQQRLYTNFITAAGVAFYFPKMKPRLYDF